MYEPRHKKSNQGGRVAFCLCALGVYLLDQLSKDAVVSRMRLRESIALIPDFFHLTFIMNSGASFGMLQGRAPLFIWMTCAVVLFICWTVYFQKNIDAGVRVLLGLITGGALGNLTDRLRCGAVVDFLDFRGIWAYIFNVADMAVVCGGILLACSLLFDEWKVIRKRPKH